MHFAGIGSQTIADHWLDSSLHRSHESTFHIMAQTMHDQSRHDRRLCIHFDSAIKFVANDPQMSAVAIAHAISTRPTHWRTH